MLKVAPLGSRLLVCSHWASVRSTCVSPVPGLATKVVAVVATVLLVRLFRLPVFHAPVPKAAPVRGLMLVAGMFRAVGLCSAWRPPAVPVGFGVADSAVFPCP